MFAVGVISPNASDYGALSGGVVLFNETDNVAMSQQQNFFYRLKYFIPLPYGVTSVLRPHSIARYNGRTYIVGCYNYNVMLDEYHRMWKQGIRPPMEGPVIAGAAGTGRICYLSWWDEVTAERSPLSPGTEIGSGGPRVWTLPLQPPDDLFSSEGTVAWDGVSAIGGSSASRIFYMRPGDGVTFWAGGVTTGTDTVSVVRGSSAFNCVFNTQPTGDTMMVNPITRATHLELWMSLGGGSPRLIMRVPQGTVSVTESTDVGLLGETYMGDFQRFPRCTMNTIYHDRQVMSGDADAPDTVYLSELYYPERYSGMYFRTRNGEPVISVLGTRDYCLILTAVSSYVLQGYTEDDMTLTVADPNIGTVTHVGNTVIHGVPYVWTASGPYMFNGSWHPISPENRHYLRAQQAQSVIPFEFWQGTHDPIWNTWVTGGRFVLDYATVQPEAGGGMQTARFSEDELTSANISPYTLSSSWKHLGHFMVPYGETEGSLFGAIDPMGLIPLVTGDMQPEDFSFWIVKMKNDPTQSGLVEMRPTNQSGGHFAAMVPTRFEVHTGYNLVGGDGGPREAKIFPKLWYHVKGDGGLCQVFQYADEVEEGHWVYVYVTSGIKVCPYSGEEDLVYASPPPEDERDITTAVFQRIGSHMPGLTSLASGRGLVVKLVGDRLAGQIRFLGYGGYYIAGPQTFLYPAPVS